jgi:hypothetical protein
LKRLLLALGLALFALAAPVAAQQMSGSHSVTGDWKIQATGDSFIAGNLHLSQVGNTVVGSAEAASSKGTGVLQMSGTLNGSTVSGKWRAPTGNVGWITLHLHGMSSFNGEWGYGGRSANGTIVAQKIRTTAF